MGTGLITAFTKYLERYVDLGKSRLETLAMLTLGMIAARTVNLSHIAPERGASGVLISSTYRRLQRFFQHVRLPKDWAAQLIVAMVGWPGKRVLVLDRTNWKIGGRHVNILALAVATPHGQSFLMWTVLDRAGNSGAPERIELMERYADRIDGALPRRIWQGQHFHAAGRPGVHWQDLAQLSDKA